MPKAICKKCGQVFIGWAVDIGCVGICDICGGEIILKEG